MARKKILLVVLIGANLLMLVIAIITIPPNFRKTSKVSDVDLSKEWETSDIDFSTDARPDLKDFLWYTEGVQYDGVPAEATAIDNINPLIGGWKTLIIYDPNNEFNSNATELLNISLTGTKEDVSFILDWYMILWANDGEFLDETDMADTVFNGRWDETGLWASGLGTIRMIQFYSLNNKQYAIGTMDTPDGTPAFIAMVRP